VATSCTASKPLRCDGDQLVSCNADGTGETDETCALGCKADEVRCNDLDPSNGLATYLDMASGQPALDMTAGGTIDTDTGAVMVAGQQVNVLTAVATQASGPSIRVLAVQSFTAGDVTVTGTNALAIVSDGDVEIEGTLSVSANGPTSGAGMWTEASCEGKPGASITAPHWVSGGTGGGGFGTPGGHGGAATLNATDGTYSEARRQWRRGDDTCASRGRPHERWRRVHGTGGGGGVGRIRINTTGTGAVQLSGLVSPSPSTGAVSVR
jgi:hypothetical protein